MFRFFPGCFVWFSWVIDIHISMAPPGGANFPFPYAYIRLEFGDGCSHHNCKSSLNSNNRIQLQSLRLRWRRENAPDRWDCSPCCGSYNLVPTGVQKQQIPKQWLRSPIGSRLHVYCFNNFAMSDETGNGSAIGHAFLDHGATSSFVYSVRGVRRRSSKLYETNKLNVLDDAKSGRWQQLLHKLDLCPFLVNVGPRLGRWSALRQAKFQQKSEEKRPTNVNKNQQP